VYVDSPLGTSVSPCDEFDENIFSLTNNFDQRYFPTNKFRQQKIQIYRLYLRYW
jgi:hypothetical protein